MRFPLSIELRRSRILTTGLGIGHILAMVGVLTLPWPVAIQVSLLVGLIFSLFVNLGRKMPIAALRLEAPGRLSVRSFHAGDEWTPADLSSSVILGALVVIRLRCQAKGRLASLVLLPDSAQAADLRVLRVWLRCYRASTTRNESRRV